MTDWKEALHKKVADYIEEQMVHFDHAPDEEEIVELLAPLVVELLEALETLKVAVNDKVEDKGATNFIEQALANAKKKLGVE